MTLLRITFVNLIVNAQLGVIWFFRHLCNTWIVRLLLWKSLSPINEITIHSPLPREITTFLCCRQCCYAHTHIISIFLCKSWVFQNCFVFRNWKQIRWKFESCICTGILYLRKLYLWWIIIGKRKTYLKLYQSLQFCIYI